MNENLMFAEEDDDFEKNANTISNGWKLLIVDDEPAIHEITCLALDGFTYEGRGLKFLHAYSAQEAMTLLAEQDDIAAALIDVVMETEHAGLKLVNSIRNELNNKLIRLILRTGQPGQAPERQVLTDFDINDYKEKTELSSQKLFSTVYTSIRSYRDIIALEDNRKGLKRVIEASTEIYQMQKLSEFINGVLQQLVAVLYLDHDSVYMNFDGIALERHHGKATILAATGAYCEDIGKDPATILPQHKIDVIKRAISEGNCIHLENSYAIPFSPGKGIDDVLFFSTPKHLNEDDNELIKLFSKNVSVAYRNLLLHKEIEDTQREILYMLGEAIETRSRETGSHVRRVAEYSRILASSCGLSDRDVELILVASPLHDFGKIGIPDNVLHKAGKLDNSEWVNMKTHAELGEEMLGRSNREVMQAAAIIAGQHHEKWDGSGYPRGLAGKDIHIYARIVALADVFDALSSKRCYKDPWPIDKVLSLIEEQKGRHFDPELVDLLMENLDDYLTVADKYPD